MKRIRLVLPLLFTVFLCQATGLSPLPSIGTPTKEAVASWYGKAHEGRKTASGAIFRRQLMTAAHRTARPETGASPGPSALCTTTSVAGASRSWKPP